MREYTPAEQDEMLALEAMINLLGGRVRWFPDHSFESTWEYWQVLSVAVPGWYFLKTELEDFPSRDMKCKLTLMRNTIKAVAEGAEITTSRN